MNDKKSKNVKISLQKKEITITKMYVISGGGDNMEHITDEEIMFYILNID